LMLNGHSARKIAVLLQSFIDSVTRVRKGAGEYQWRV